LQGENERMTINEAVLVRNLLDLSYKFNDNEWDYMQCCELYEDYDSSYQVARHQMNMRDELKKYSQIKPIKRSTGL
jgi:hypothetical protein